MHSVVGFFVFSIFRMCDHYNGNLKNSFITQKETWYLIPTPSSCLRQCCLFWTFHINVTWSFVNSFFHLACFQVIHLLIILLRMDIPDFLYLFIIWWKFWCVPWMMLLWTYLYKFCVDVCFHFFRSRMLGHIVTLFLTCWGTAELFSRGLHYPLPSAVCEGSSCFPPSLALVLAVWL